MKLEKFIIKFYRFSSLKEIGKIGLGASGIVVLIGLISFLFINQGSDASLPAPKYSSSVQYMTIDPTHVKKEDAYFHLFLDGIKKNGGALVLGTSESGELNKFNYWELLNSDSTINSQFSVLYGAGRSCERYIPSIINNPEHWNGIELLVFINPVYWREGLDRFNIEYHERYMDYASLRAARSRSKHKDQIDILFEGGKSITNAGSSENVNHFFDDNIYPLYNKRLRGLMGLKKQEINHLTPLPVTNSTQFHPSKEQLDAIKSEINPTLNCSNEFLKKEENPTLTALNLSSEYRKTSLHYFISLCKENNIKATFIVGPYNRILAKKKGQSGEIRQYEAVLSQIKKDLTKENMPYIDASGISSVNQTFIDQQHHSKYGGYMIYELIKKHWNEKMDN
ncbi:MAG: hypothetical protein HRT57_07625 [Crocinitomicaceae bacterium]|nr:hypothetical protein [Crocinitomicaceae bacterium]